MSWLNVEKIKKKKILSYGPLKIWEFKPCKQDISKKE